MAEVTVEVTAEAMAEVTTVAATIMAGTIIMGEVFIQAMPLVHMD
jgi:hypothetical protein